MPSPVFCTQVGADELTSTLHVSEQFLQGQLRSQKQPLGRATWALLALQAISILLLALLLAGQHRIFTQQVACRVPQRSLRHEMLLFHSPLLEAGMGLPSIADKACAPATSRVAGRPAHRGAAFSTQSVIHGGFKCERTSHLISAGFCGVHFTGT